MLSSVVFLLALLTIATAGNQSDDPAIDVVGFVPEFANSAPSLLDTPLRLAALDSHRYLRLLTCGHGSLSSACVRIRSTSDFADKDGSSVLVAIREAVPVNLLSASSTLAASMANLSGDAHVVQTVTLPNNHSVTICSGSTPRAVLYSVYALLEQLGARFYLWGDILPEANAIRVLKLLRDRDAGSVVAVPRFVHRGLQPFHDFPMGPDFWTLDFYRATATQMAKLKMNRWGFHTYPVDGPTEPFVWVGTADGYDAATGAVLDTAAYPASWYLTQNFSRGNLPGSISRATSDYCCGASQVFPRDCYGSDAQATTCFPESPAAEAKVFNNAAALLGQAFSWAQSFASVDSCVGTEIPLERPSLPYLANATLQELYEGIFGRLLAANVSASCYWLWTTEAVEDHSTGKGLPQNNPLWAQLTAEIQTAIAARDAVAPSLSVGTNGWCLGPGDNSSYFDYVISNDTDFSLASIDPLLGWGQVDPGFASVTRHAATVIPWMEDDMGLAGAELWVNRTLWHAADAASYNATGLLGILWRTWITSPQIAALAASGWQGADNTSALDIYTDFCASNFGADTAGVCASLFMAVDGSSDPLSTDMATSILPRGGQFCCGGPLGPTGSEGPISFLNTTGFENWLPTVTGAANIERATRWVNVFLYHNSMAWVSTAAQNLAAAAALVHDEATVRQYGFPALTALSDAYTDMMTLLLSFASSPGELGMLVAHEGMNWPAYLLAAAGPILSYTQHCAAYDDPTAHCYPDWNVNRTLPYTVSISDPSNSRERCAAECKTAGYAWAGVEFGVACFCGNDLPADVQPLPLSACANMSCAAAPGEACGGPDILSVYPSDCHATSGLPPNLFPSHSYMGAAPRVFPTAVRTTVSASEGNLAVDVVVLADNEPTSVSLTWWPVAIEGDPVHLHCAYQQGTRVDIGGGANTTVAMTGVPSRGLYSASIPVAGDSAMQMEYVVAAEWADGATVMWPVEGAQSVLVL